MNSSHRFSTPVAEVKHHFSRRDPVIHEALSSVNFDEWFGVNDKTDHFFNLAREIIYQQLSGKAASTIWGRVTNLVGKVTPENILAFEDKEFRAVGVSWSKAKYIKDLAAKTLSGEVVLTHLSELTDEAVIEELTKVKGIGRWTAEMFLIFTLSRENVFSLGDLGLKKGIAKLYGIDEPSPDQILSIISPWSPYKSYGAIALWNYLDNTP